MKKKVIVAMSGGVDSSVTALLLKKQGYEVEGMFMKNWEEEGDSYECTAEEDLNDAEKVCKILNIKLHTVNFAHEYWEQVFSHFLTTLQKGQTPNPDILCNKYVKFGVFLEHAKKMGAEFMATGHYARIIKQYDRYFLCKGLDKSKDQSYFLYTLNQEQLSYSLFPIGEFIKPKIRQIAKENDLPNASKKDSTGICFIGERKFKNFLAEYLPAKPGDIVDIDGNIIGKHNGLMYYTLGQRQGLNIGGLSKSCGEPFYVAKKNLLNNKLTVVQGKNHPQLFKDELIAEDIHWINDINLQANVFAKTRYRQEDVACNISELENNNKKLKVKFTNPQRALTPGQAIVFYDGDVCLGGGTIT